MDDRVLFASKRGHTAKATRDAAEKGKRRGFKLILQMMCGLPGQNDNNTLDTQER
jgi:histone acetyltransferase (RNA polymerase elongator complex component)